MPDKQDTQQTDWNPWAAYVTGHHPELLWMNQEILWEELIIKSREVDEQTLIGINEEVEELRRAMRILALADQIKPAILVELHRAVDSLAANAEMIAAEPDYFDPEFTWPPGIGEWLEMINLASCAVSPCPNLGAWSKLGAAVGKCRRLLYQGHDRYGEYRQEVGRLLALVEPLQGSGRNRFLERVVDVVGNTVEPAGEETLPSFGERVRKHYLEMAQFDSGILHALQLKEIPEPVLQLDQQRLVFFGQVLELEGHNEDQIGCLWVLAERAGQPVQMKVIQEEAKMASSKVSTFKSIVTRLRQSLLKPLIEQFRLHKPGPPMPKENLCFIQGGGKRFHTGRWSSYSLVLNPEEVRIIGPRPRWMKPSSNR